MPYCQFCMEQPRWTTVRWQNRYEIFTISSNSVSTQSLAFTVPFSGIKCNLPFSSNRHPQKNEGPPLHGKASWRLDCYQD